MQSLDFILGDMPKVHPCMRSDRGVDDGEDNISFIVKTACVKHLILHLQVKHMLLAYSIEERMGFIPSQKWLILEIRKYIN